MSFILFDSFTSDVDNVVVVVQQEQRRRIVRVET